MYYDWSLYSTSIKYYYMYYDWSLNKGTLNTFIHKI